MRCPKCGARIPRESPICFKCGTKMTSVREASFTAVKEARKTYQPEKIVMSSFFPKDLSYKKTLLMCIFLGYFGGHQFYTQKYPQGIAYLVGSLFFLLCLIIPGAIVGFDIEFTIAIQTIYSTQATYALFVIACMVGATILVLWLKDLFNIICKRFKVPVVLKEK